MRGRVERVCKGHLKWIFQKANGSGGLFSPHYWVNGQEIDEWEDNSDHPGKSLVDTPFQIIKAGDFYEVLKRMRENKMKEKMDENIKEEVKEEVKEGVKEEIMKEEREAVKGIVEVWIKDFDQTNKLGLYAFPRYREERTHKFYFTDHVLIWRAIKSAESLNPKQPLQVPEEASDQQTNKKQRGRSYSSTKVQYNILKRFTTENPISRKRMIAVSRSPAQTRFLLRTKDASLFHSMELKLFEKLGAQKSDDVWQNKIDVWRNTIDC